eukprot:GEZU01002252.1.p1 GENE.GEZU01002252.1~~GEZU01002252.1.p1  ORF type:complete len:147 (+),score=25.02 GEZU01002252.1:66-443(+)
MQRSVVSSEAAMAQPIPVAPIPTSIEAVEYLEHERAARKARRDQRRLQRQQQQLSSRPKVGAVMKANDKQRELRQAPEQPQPKDPEKLITHPIDRIMRDDFIKLVTTDLKVCQHIDVYPSYLFLL